MGCVKSICGKIKWQLIELNNAKEGKGKQLGLYKFLFHCICCDKMAKCLFHVLFHAFLFLHLHSAQVHLFSIHNPHINTSRHVILHDDTALSNLRWTLRCEPVISCYNHRNSIQTDQDSWHQGPASKSVKAHTSSIVPWWDEICNLWTQALSY